MTRRLSVEELEGCSKSVNIRGYAIINNYLDLGLVTKTLDYVRSDFRRELEDNPSLRNVTNNQSRDKYLYHLQFKRKSYLDLLTSENLLDVLIPFLNDPFYRQLPEDDPNFLLGYYNARSSVAALPLHQDNYITYSGGSPISMQIVISLSGQNKENGATTLVPGTHQSGRLPDREFHDVQVLNLDPGDAVIWDSRLWHGALENTSKRDRWSLVATFRPWWAKQNYDSVRGLSAALFHSITKRQKALLGFLSLPAVDEKEKVALKEGYADLLDSIHDYRGRRITDA